MCKTYLHTFFPHWHHVSICIQFYFRLLIHFQLLGGTLLSKGRPWYFKVIGESPFVCISTPEAVQHVLQDNFDNYVKVNAEITIVATLFCVSLLILPLIYFSMKSCWSYLPIFYFTLEIEFIRCSNNKVLTSCAFYNGQLFREHFSEANFLNCLAMEFLMSMVPSGAIRLFSQLLFTLANTQKSRIRFLLFTMIWSTIGIYIFK